MYLRTPTVNIVVGPLGPYGISNCPARLAPPPPPKRARTAPQQEFKKGDRVDAKFGRWYRGTVDDVIRDGAGKITKYEIKKKLEQRRLEPHRSRERPRARGGDGGGVRQFLGTRGSHPDEDAGVEGDPIVRSATTHFDFVRAIILIKAFNRKLLAGEFFHVFDPIDEGICPRCPPLAEPLELPGIADDANP